MFHRTEQKKIKETVTIYHDSSEKKKYYKEIDNEKNIQIQNKILCNIIVHIYKYNIIVLLHATNNIFHNN